ncbi:PREDICTED: polyadenylate-binding protein RBP45B [Tarenaya hassleriana]|uniref:polyadenylate-binding protein RBP45B n=1 Tax=Tarenaya hassleriana TaxID=28532 RepID=UPI00053C9C80|nr:PREDICTED: polyadenylate-binding protein RBP45B [Tarenaya hassleriana]
MMQQPPPGGMVPPPSTVGSLPPAQPQYGYQQPSPYGMTPPPYSQSAGAAPTQMWSQQIPIAGVPGQAVEPASADEIRTLWIGDLQYWMDENFLFNCFAHTGEVSSVKVIRNKQTQQIEGYGFLEFVSRAAAERVLQTYNGTPIPSFPDQLFRLNWASSGEKRDDSPDFTIFVGDLAADVTDYILLETFRARYPSVKGGKVVIDRVTGRTKGYGFVRFGDESEQLRAMTEMNGVLCSTRPMRIGPAASKKGVSGQKDSYQSGQGIPTDNDPTNTTVFVGGLDPSVTDDHLRKVFGQYGEIVHVKIPAGKRCGFVQFSEKSCAEEALRMLNGLQLGGQSVRLSWGRSPTSKQGQATGGVSQWYYGGSGYGQGQEYYGYSAQDPNMYYGGYPGYQQQPGQQQGQQPGQQSGQQQVGFSY